MRLDREVVSVDGVELQMEWRPQVRGATGGRGTAVGGGAIVGGMVL